MNPAYIAAKIVNYFMNHAVLEIHPKQNFKLLVQT